MYLRLIILVTIQFLALRNALAQKTIELYDHTQEFIFAYDCFAILEDSSNTLNINQISRPEFAQKFIVNKEKYSYNANIKSTYWIRFKARNHSKTGKKFLMESFAPHTDDWRLYIPEKDTFIEKKSGLDIPFYEREFINKNLILDFPSDSTIAYTYYIKAYSTNFSSFDFRLKPYNYFFFYSVNEYYFLGIFYGIAVIMIIYNLLMFFYLGQRLYIFLVFYICAGALTTLADDGLGYQYVWVNLPGLNHYAGVHIAPILLLISIVLYSREFLELKINFPKLDRWVLGLTGLYLIYHILKTFLLPAYLHIHVFYLLPFALLLYISILSFRKKVRAARFFLFGFVVVFISVVLLKLRATGLIVGNLYTVNSLNAGIVLELIGFSLALADRMKMTLKEREDALRERNEAQFKAIRQLRINEELKDKVNRELETKVAERTQELNEKNLALEEVVEQLKIMTAKANEMSLKLDMDNWQLQKVVQESLRDRMAGKIISMEEFNKVFPDEASCHRYLYELKWDKTYHCSKCGHKESHKEEKGFSKKCMKCGYLESVTANTLFHALKFPIQKAFLMTYLMIHSETKLTLEELAQIVDLHRNTCWKFRQKITEAMEAYKKTHKVTKVQSWENVMLYNETKGK